jgi:uncharacterized protein YoxC
MQVLAMKYDYVLIGLYLLVLFVIAKELFSMVAITVVLVLLMVVVMVQKMGLENSISSTGKKNERKIEEMTTKVDDVSKKADRYKEDTNRQLEFVDNKVADVKQFVEVEIANAYGDLSRRIADLEDRVNEIRQIFAAAVGSLDERVQGVEKKEEESF